jgi:hypothetical protein
LLVQKLHAAWSDTDPFDGGFSLGLCPDHVEESLPQRACGGLAIRSCSAGKEAPQLPAFEKALLSRLGQGQLEGVQEYFRYAVIGHGSFVIGALQRLLLQVQSMKDKGQMTNDK